MAAVTLSSAWTRAPVPSFTKSSTLALTRAPQLKDERRVITDLIDTEKPKITALIERGATQYFLLTNVFGTGHLDVGSIDTAHAKLSAALGIAVHIWWRDDLDARLDNAPEISVGWGCRRRWRRRC